MNKLVRILYSCMFGHFSQRVPKEKLVEKGKSKLKIRE